MLCYLRARALVEQFFRRIQDSALHRLRHFLQNGYISERVAIDDDDVCKLPFFNRADIVLEAEEFGSGLDRSFNRLTWSHTEFDEALELQRGIDVPCEAAYIGTESDLDSSFHRATHGVLINGDHLGPH